MAGMPIWYELMTADPLSVAPFYRATLKWEIGPGEAMPNGVTYGMIGRADGGHAGGALTLSPAMRDSGARPGWLPYFHVGDVDAAAAEAQELGGSVQMPPVSMDGVGRMAMLADPQGAPFYVMAPTPPAGQPDAQSDVFDPQKAGHCRWNELNTRDAAGALAFYTALFDWTPGMAMPMGEAGDYRFIEHEGLAIGAVNPVRAGPSHWLPVFGVEEIQAAKAAAEANGGIVTQDLQEIPGGEFALGVTDPGGAALAFVGPKRGA
ncbi:VOC family protein [Sphingomonas parva]|uniref:VOC family protein n=1 Tax=Sphingomonas parva TaxID=2555898 RepID=A0A4Y8ZP59_9SPHN|nr:VOC family protein [Sphingomonas parva]TFI57791.1 VOC family protein [Sphingomonas parva]